MPILNCDCKFFYRADILFLTTPGSIQDGHELHSFN